MGKIINFIDPKMIAFYKGMAAYRKALAAANQSFSLGKKDKPYYDIEPKPKDNWTDEEWNGPLNSEQMFLMGWRMARGEEVSKSYRTKEKLGIR